MLLSAIAVIATTVNSCTDLNDKVETAEQTAPKFSHTKSLDEALKEMYLFWEDAYGKTGTKSSVVSRPAIASIDVCSAVITKGEGNNTREDLADIDEYDTDDYKYNTYFIYY